MNLHAIEQMQLLASKSPRHRADQLRGRVASPRTISTQLQGALGKMSASNTDSVSSSRTRTTRSGGKIMTHAFSGGRETAKLQRELGADLEIDVAYQWLRFFLEDDEELDAIGKSYGSSRGHTGTRRPSRSASSSSCRSSCGRTRPGGTS